MGNHDKDMMIRDLRLCRDEGQSDLPGKSLRPTEVGRKCS